MSVSRDRLSPKGLRTSLLAIFVLSGFAGLIYQSIWSHYLGLFLGHAAYAQALVAATPSNLLVGETKPKKMTGVSADQMAKMEREMGNLQEQFKLAEQTYGQDILNLVLAKGYLAKLMANEAILRHLTRNHHDVLNEFDSIVRMVALDK